MSIQAYVRNHTISGACKCSGCSQGGQPLAGHTVDMVFFEMTVQGESSSDDFVRLTREHGAGGYVAIDPLDGRRYNHLVLGTWIGDESLALAYMGLGALLGVFDLHTPRTLEKARDLTDEEVLRLATVGHVLVSAKAAP